MQRTIGVIDLGDFSCQPESRYGHQPYPLRTLGGRRVFEWMVDRLNKCALIDAVVVVGCHVPAHLIAMPRGGVGGPARHQTVLSDHPRALSRLSQAAEMLECQWCVYMPATRPFVDPERIDHLLNHRDDGDCDFIGYDGENPDDTVGEIFHIDAIRRLRRQSAALAVEGGQTGSIRSILDHAPGAFHLKLLPQPSSAQRPDWQRTIVDEWDWEIVRSHVVGSHVVDSQVVDSLDVGSQVVDSQVGAAAG